MKVRLQIDEIQGYAHIDSAYDDSCADLTLVRNPWDIAADRHSEGVKDRIVDLWRCDASSMDGFTEGSVYCIREVYPDNRPNLYEIEVREVDLEIPDEWEDETESINQ